MRVLILVNQYPPFATSSARLYSELVHDLAGGGHEVTVVTTAPPATRAAAPSSETKGVTVVRLPPSRLPANVPLLRAAEQLTSAVEYAVAAFGRRRHDAVLVYSPPLPLGLTGIALARRWKCPCIVNVQDLYPKTAIDLGLLKGRGAIALAQWMERRVYRGADAIVVHSEGNRRYVVDRGAAPESTRVIHNWTEDEPRVADETARAAVEAHVPPGRFVVFYGGAMGWAQALDDVLGAAEALKGDEEIFFLMVGDGVMRAPMEELARRQGLANVRFVPTVPPEEYRRLLAGSDVALVTLRHELASPVVPGKLQSIMAAGKVPVVSANPMSDARGIVEESGCGVFVEAGQPAALAAVLARLKAERARLPTMGASGRDYAAKHFNRRDGTRAFALLFAETLRRKRS